MKNGADTFRLGSTWDRENIDCNPTPAARVELLKILANMFKTDIEVEGVDCRAGVRPCTATTRPHLGVHPTEPDILSFNGFGSKGFALCPYFSKNFADWIYGKSALDSEADLSRHIRKFWKP